MTSRLVFSSKGTGLVAIVYFDLFTVFLMAFTLVTYNSTQLESTNPPNTLQFPFIIAIHLSQGPFSMFAVSPTWIDCAILVAVLCMYFYNKGKGNPKKLPLPPGPTPLPIIGNMHQAPKHHDWLHYTEWFGKYGIHSLLSNIMSESTEVSFRASRLFSPVSTTRYRDQYVPGCQ